MYELVEKLKEARSEFIKLVESFPKEKREEVLFDKWCLKDLLAHLTGWNIHQIKALEHLVAGKQFELPKNLKNSINIDFVQERLDRSFEKVYQEFLEASQELVETYENTPSKLWHKPLFDKKQKTPEEFIQIEINHLNNTHGPQIKKALKRL